MVANKIDLAAARRSVNEVVIDDALKDYIVQLVYATRRPAAYRPPARARFLIGYGASPRASIALAQASRAHAFLQGRGYTTPDDVKALAHDVLRHRVVTTYEAEAEELPATTSSTACLTADVPWGGPRASLQHGARQRFPGKVSPARAPRAASRRSCSNAHPRHRDQGPLFLARLNDLPSANTTRSSAAAGIEFDELRPHVLGDDVRSIELKARPHRSAADPPVPRRPRPHGALRRRRECPCRRLPCSNRKRTLAAEICAVLALAAIRNKDRVGLLLFASKPERYVRFLGGATPRPPRRSRDAQRTC
ncbi:MAG: MoxR family ATPase [Dehalococcoidia bacterium]